MKNITEIYAKYTKLFFFPIFYLINNLKIEFTN